MDDIATTFEPGDIDASYVARVVPESFVVRIGDESLVVAGADRVLALNSSAAMVFRFLDGDASVAALADDFSEVLGVERADVEQQVLEFVRELGVNGLLEGVESEVRSEPTSGAFPPGAEVGQLGLVDLDSRKYSLADHRGRRVALVNWSPTCGFCSGILPQLTDLAEPLGAAGVDLLFLTGGDVDSNRAQFAEAGCGAAVVMRDGADDPFGSLGTPSLLVVDAHGIIAEPVVLGANRLPECLRALAGSTPAVTDATARYLPAPTAMCGAGGGVTGTSTDWLGTRVYALGEHHVGLRCNSSSTAELLDRLFAGAVVDDPKAPDNYAVSLADDRDATTRTLDLLVRGGTQLVRSRSARRVVGALLSQLSAELAEPSDGLTRATATVALRGDRALLLPPDLVDRVSRLQPQLTRAGIRLADVPYATLDLGARELVVPEPIVAHDADVLADLDGERLASEAREVAPGRYPVEAWYFVRTRDRRGELSPATAVGAALLFLRDVDDLEAAVETLSQLFAGGTSAIGLWYSSLEELVEQLAP